MTRKTDYKTLYKAVMAAYARAVLLNDQEVSMQLDLAAGRARVVYLLLEREELRERAGG